MGDAKPKCGARKSKGGQHTGELCKLPKGYQTEHPGYGNCKFHGGDTPNGKKWAAEELAREMVDRQRQRLGLFGGRVVVQPADVLLQELQRSQAIVANIERSMAQWAEVGYPDAAGHEDGPALEPGEINNGVTVWGETLTGLPQLVAVHKTEYRIGYTDTEWAAWIKVYREERQHLLKVAQACIAAGVLERQQRMMEANAQLTRKIQERALQILGIEVEPEALAAAMQQAIPSVVNEARQLTA